MGIRSQLWIGRGFSAVQHQPAELQKSISHTDGSLARGKLLFLVLGCAAPCSMSCCLGQSMVHLSIPYPTPVHKKGAVYFLEEQTCDHMEVWGLYWNFLFFPAWLQFHSSRDDNQCCLWSLPSDTSHQLGMIWAFTGSLSSTEICMWKLPSFASCGYMAMIRSVSTSPSPLVVSNFPFLLLFQLLNCQKEPVLCHCTEAVFGVLWKCLCEWFFQLLKIAELIFQFPSQHLSLQISWWLCGCVLPHLVRKLKKWKIVQ